MNRSTKAAIIIMAAALAITAVGAHLSYEEFQTPNFISVLYGMARVSLFGTECIEINNNPLIIMTRDRAAIEEYMLSYGGYTIKEQLGAGYIFENENSTISVDSDTKIYWIIWVIGEPIPKQD